MGGNWSLVGMDATRIKLEKPTMELDLRGFPSELQESLVIHQFGHALGLEHEHQRSDFWDVMEKHVDIDKMKMDPDLNPSQSTPGSDGVMQSWFRKKPDKHGTQSVNSLSEYDPDSIMHYQ